MIKPGIAKALEGIKGVGVFKFISRGAAEKIGQAPGTLVHIGEIKAEEVTISVIDYDASSCTEKRAQAVEDCFPFKDTPTVTWINVNGLHDTELIGKIGAHFGLHPLVLEDIVHANQRPKMEDFESYVFIVLKMLHYSEDDREVKAEQVSFILGDNFVISFQEAAGDGFNPLRSRIRKARGRIRKQGADYLLYALMDAVVDGYFVILEKMGEKIEALEEVLMQDPPPETLKAIHGLRSEAIFLRKSVWPLRDVINDLESGDPVLVTEPVTIYFRDVYDHTIRVIETLETCRDLVSGMHDMYHSAISNKMNEIMKVLTIIATMFIPLTFIAGIYGMNFEHMPELRWRWSYPALWAVLVMVGAAMFVFFRKKKWM
ncbi:magnesium/cobalt transporter CorA [Thermodesulfobacteriota bacterium]